MTPILLTLIISLSICYGFPSLFGAPNSVAHLYVDQKAVGEKQSPIFSKIVRRANPLNLLGRNNNDMNAIQWSGSQQPG